ncbi:MAG: NnrU protein [Betaproteobacteria bacterium]|nr:MAG: NnrU protein [Betaproteobacteria bacterium]
MSPRAINAGRGHRSTPGTVKNVTVRTAGPLRTLTVSTLHGSIASNRIQLGEVGMDPMEMLALATIVFLVTHSVSSTPLRSGLVALLGENAYLGLYTLVSLLTLGWMIWAYVEAPYERLWVGDEFKAWAVALMPVSLVLIASGALTRNPSAVRQESALRTMGEPRGILRVTRHPILWGIALWAAVHLISRGDTASLIFFGGFLLLAASGTVLQDRRKDRMIGVDWQRFAVTTSNFPFAAIIQGRNQFRFDEIGWGKVLAGLALYFVLAFLHPYLFGARPY